MWRYFGVRDLMAVFKAVLSGTLGSVLLVLLLFRFAGYSRAVFVVHGMVLFLLVSGSRFLFRALLESRQFPRDGVRVVVVGAGDRGEHCLRALRHRPGGYLPVGILDPDRRLKGRKILGVPVLGNLGALERIVERDGIREVILSGPLEDGELEDLRQRCERIDLPLFLAPVPDDFVRI